MGKSTISMAMFNSYVSLPEGTLKIPKMDWFLLSMAISGTDWLEVPTICKGYIRPM